MTDFKELREALDAGPTEGPWIAAGPSFGAHLPVFCDEVVLDRDDEDDCETVCQAPPERAAEATVDMRYIAAANPATIRALLAELDAARRDAAEIQKQVKRKMLLDLWDALPGHEKTGDCAGSLRAMLLFSEVGDEIRETRLGR